MDDADMFYDTPRLENSFRGGSDRIKPKRREKNSTHKSRTDNEKIQIKTKRKGEATTDHHADSSDERPTASFSRGVSKRSRDNDRDTIIKIRGQTYDKSGHGVDIRKTGAFSSLSTEECESDTLRFHFFYKTFNFLKQTIIVSTKYNCDKKCKISKKFFIVSSFLCLIYIVICYFGSSVEIVSEILKTSSTYMVDMTTMFQWSRDDSSVKHGVDFKRNSEENRTYDTGKRKTERIRTSEESRKNDPPKDNDDMLTALSIVVDKKLKKYERMMVDILKFINKHIYNEVLEYIKSCEFEINIDNDMFKQTKNDNIKISVADVHRLINDKIVSTLKSMRKYAKYELFEESGEINKEEDDDEEEYLMFEFLSDVFLLSEQKRDKNDDQMRHRQHDLHSVMYDILNKETTRHVFDYLISNSKEYRCCCKRASNEKQLQTAYACGTELPSKYKRQPEGGVNIDYDNFPICFLENNRYIYDNIVKPNQSDSKSTTRNNDEHKIEEDEEEENDRDDLVDMFGQLTDVVNYDFITDYDRVLSKSRLIDRNVRVDDALDYGIVIGINNGTASDASKEQQSSRPKKQNEKNRTLLKKVDSKQHQQLNDDGSVSTIYYDHIVCKISFILNQ